MPPGGDAVVKVLRLWCKGHANERNIMRCLAVILGIIVLLNFATHASGRQTIPIVVDGNLEILATQTDLHENHPVSQFISTVRQMRQQNSNLKWAVSANGRSIIAGDGKDDTIVFDLNTYQKMTAPPCLPIRHLRDNFWLVTTPWTRLAVLDTSTTHLTRLPLSARDAAISTNKTIVALCSQAVVIVDNDGFQIESIPLDGFKGGSYQRIWHSQSQSRVIVGGDWVIEAGSRPIYACAVVDLTDGTITPMWTSSNAPAPDLSVFTGGDMDNALYVVGSRSAGMPRWHIYVLHDNDNPSKWKLYKRLPGMSSSRIVSQSTETDWIVQTDPGDILNKSPRITRMRSISQSGSDIRLGEWDGGPFVLLVDP